MTPDYRAMCAELADALVEWQLGGGPPEDTADADLIDRARTLLAKADGPAVPDGREPASVTTQPSDAELDELAWTWYSKTGSTWYQIEAFRAYARAVLARWGRPTPQPVPLSERLPGPEDCDEQGRCWMLLKVAGDWRLVNPEKSGLPQLEYGFSHWLPAHALPLPTPDAL